jgi:hypothetical protein
MGMKKRRTGPPRTRLKKSDIRPLLLDRDLERVARLAEGRGVLRALISLLYDMEPLVFWRAIEAIGVAAGVVAKYDHERVRKHIRNLLWMMNDESGALCRRAPEAIGEILINVPDLIDEFAHILPSFLWEEPFERGIRCAIYRVGGMRPETRVIYAGCIGDLIKSLGHDSESIRGYSLFALKPLREQIEASGFALPEVEAATVPMYNFDTGQLRQETIGVSDILL